MARAVTSDEKNSILEDILQARYESSVGWVERECGTQHLYKGVCKVNFVSCFTT